MKKIILSILLFLTIAISISVYKQTKVERYEASFLDLFDTVTKIVGYADSKKEFTEKTELIYQELEEYHQLFDIYNNYDGIQNIKTINDNAGIKPVKVDRKIIDLLIYSKEMHELSEGKFNIAFGSVLSLWHEKRTFGIDNPEQAVLPDMKQLEEMATHTDIDKVIINEEESTVFLEDKQMSLDVGAVAKGYATEMVSRYMIEIGLSNSMISVGGNVRTIGSKFDEYQNEKPWSVGIQNPDKDSSENTLYILNLKDKSLVTSGIYERYYTVDGKQYHHIINPETLMPTEYFASVSIVCKDSGLADVLSTSIFNMTYEQGYALIEKLEDTEALWIFNDGTQKSSSGFSKLIKE